jgi:hypothetical protein
LYPINSAEKNEPHKYEVHRKLEFNFKKGEPKPALTFTTNRALNQRHSLLPGL